MLQVQYSFKKMSTKILLTYIPEKWAEKYKRSAYNKIKYRTFSQSHFTRNRLGVCASSYCAYF